jgi:hypothetical protein
MKCRYDPCKNMAMQYNSKLPMALLKKQGGDRGAKAQWESVHVTANYT